MHTLPSNFPTLCSCWQKLFLESESWGRVRKSPTVRKPPPLPEFGAGQLFVRAAAPRLRPLQLLLASIRFNCCSPFASASSCCFRARLRHPLQLLLPVCLRLQLLLPDCARFSCCSPLASASAAAPNRFRFGCYSPIATASWSTACAAPRLRLLDSSPCHAQAQCSRTFFAEFEVQ